MDYSEYKTAKQCSSSEAELFPNNTQMHWCSNTDVMRSQVCVCRVIYNRFKCSSANPIQGAELSIL